MSQQLGPSSPVVVDVPKDVQFRARPINRPRKSQCRCPIAAVKGRAGADRNAVEARLCRRRVI